MFNSGKLASHLTRGQMLGFWGLSPGCCWWCVVFCVGFLVLFLRVCCVVLLLFLCVFIHCFYRFCCCFLCFVFVVCGWFIVCVLCLRAICRLVVVGRRGSPLACRLLRGDGAVAVWWPRPSCMSHTVGVARGVCRSRRREPFVIVLCLRSRSRSRRRLFVVRWCFAVVYLVAVFDYSLLFESLTTRCWWRMPQPMRHVERSTVESYSKAS